MNLICGRSDAKKDVCRGQAYANKQGAMYRKCQTRIGIGGT